MRYDAINHLVLASVPPRVRTILDLGCGRGEIGGVLQSSRECSVVGVTWNEEDAVFARQVVDRVEVIDLNVCDLAPLGTFDCVLCSHVLEHLFQPEQLLERLHACLVPGGTLVVALPNILFWRQRLQFVYGRFRYANSGLMDRTHYRFYDWESAAELLTGSGYRIQQQVADGGFPGSRFVGGRPQSFVDTLATAWFPGFFGWQFVFCCQSPIATRQGGVSDENFDVR